MVDLSTKFKNTTVNNLLQAMKSIRKLKATPSFLRFSKKRHLFLLSDAAHANLCDRASTIGGHMSLLIGLDIECRPLFCCANKIKHVV